MAAKKAAKAGTGGKEAPQAPEMTDDGRAMEAATAIFGCPILVLRADNQREFVELVEMAHHSGVWGPRRKELFARVREFELWREENL